MGGFKERLAELFRRTDRGADKSLKPHTTQEAIGLGIEGGIDDILGSIGLVLKNWPGVGGELFEGEGKKEDQASK